MFPNKANFPATESRDTTRHSLGASIYPHDLNPADIFSRLTDRDAWTLSPSVQRMLMQRAQAMFRKSISLDAFACPQSKVTSRFVSRYFASEALAEDGLLLDWSNEVV